MKHFAVLPLSASLTGALGGILQFRSPLDGTITQVVVIAGTANENGDTIFDVNVEGDSIFTAETRPTIAEGGTSDSALSLTAGVSEGDIITVDADDVPTGGFPAQSLTVLITIDDGQTLPIFSSATLTPRQVYALDPLTNALAPADAVLTHDAVIYDLYYGSLARVPTTGELSAARTSLLTGMNAGSAALLLAIRTLGHTLFTSAEYIARTRTNVQFVHDLYFAYLGRDSDGAGQSAWEAVLTGGASRSTVDTDFSAGTELSNIRFVRIIGAGSSPRAANPMTTASDIIVGGASGVETRLAKPAANKVLGTDAGGVFGYKDDPATRAANPMTTAGDIIVGGASGVETRVAKPAANKVWGTDSGGALGYKDDPAGGGGPVAPFDSTHPDAVPSSPNALDDEFPGSSLNTSSKWSWSNQGSAVAAVADSHLTLSHLASGGTGSNTVPSVVQSISGTFKVRAKVQIQGDAASSGGGMIIRENSSGKQIGFWIYTSSGSWTIERQDTATGARTSLVSILAPAGTHEAYLEIEEDSTTRYFRYSFSGRNGTFFTVLSHTKTTHLTTDRIGLSLFPFNGKVVLVSDWFRRIS